MIAVAVCLCSTYSAHAQLVTKTTETVSKAIPVSTQVSDAPIHLGFSPVTYTYTNVEGGLGMFWAMSVYESDWKYYEN